jgi:sulfite reductase alpha subunit-like flavoprotein
MTNPAATQQEEILVLYGSHSGISEQAATDFAEKVKDCAKADGVTAVPIVMELDDFLEKAEWRRLVVIFVSSFGKGGAPRGARKFRQLCDDWIHEYKEKPEKTQHLSGVRFFLCGQGDSKYSTFQENPNKVVEALSLAGAELIGEQGASDASNGTEQQKEIDDWIESVWAPLSEALSQEPLSEDHLQGMQAATTV